MPPRDATRAPGKNETVSTVAEQILAALETVEKAARTGLGALSGSMSLPFVRPSNPMVGEMKPERLKFAQDSEVRAQLRRLLTEPCVARVEVEWVSDRGLVRTYYFPRRSAAGMTSAIKDAYFVTQGAALGALAEHEAGDIAHIHVGGRDREGRILKRTVIDPTQHHGLWDALASEFEAMPWGDVLELLRGTSLRALLDRIKADVDDDVVGPIRRGRATRLMSGPCLVRVLRNTALPHGSPTEFTRSMQASAACRPPLCLWTVMTGSILSWKQPRRC
jgi:hypothetical protein